MEKPKPSEQERIAKLLRTMVKKQGWIEITFDHVPRVHASLKRLDVLIAKTLKGKRKRGERGKLAGGILLEDVAVDLLKWRKDRLKVEGIKTEEAWETAYVDVADLVGISEETLKDWYEGDRKRERNKPIEQRAYWRWKSKTVR